jgi:ubiquinone/menaquinone biosynthesis C-methylase UbiE
MLYPAFSTFLVCGPSSRPWYHAGPVVRVDYDREAEHYEAGRRLPVEVLEPWRAQIERFLPQSEKPLLDLGAGTGIWTRAFSVWFHVPVVAVEPSTGMRSVGTTTGLPDRAHYLAAQAEALPLGHSTCKAAWLSTVVHHLTDIEACAMELRRVLSDGAPVMIRNNFPGRQDEVELFRHFPAAAAVAATWPAVEEVVATFARAGFANSTLNRVYEDRWRDLQPFREWAIAMRHTDSVLVPISDAEFAEGLANLDRAIAAGQRPQPMGVDLLVLT